MKKALLLLLGLVSLSASAQLLERKATFNFSSKEWLQQRNVTPSESNGGVIPLDSHTFTDGLISVSFGRLSSGSLPAEIWTYKNPYTDALSYYLTVNPGSTVTFSGNGVKIKKIEFGKEGDQGIYSPMKLTDGQSGTLLSGTWTSSESVSSVSFSSNGKKSNLSSAVVTYEEPSVVLSPNIVSPANGDSVPSFKTMTLGFSSAMYVQSAADNIALTGQYSDGTAVSKKPSITGNGTSTITLTIDETLVKDGSFTVTIPAQSFRNEAGYQTVYQSYSFTVHEDRNTFNPVEDGISPAEGEVTLIPENIKIKFNGDIKLDDNLGESDIVVSKEGTPMYSGQLLADEEDQTTVILKLSHVGGITNTEDNLGTWTIDIPEMAIHNSFKGNSSLDRYNKSFRITYKLIDALAPLKNAMAGLLEEAGNMQKMIGQVGYPKVDNEENPLSAVLSLEIPSTEEELKADTAKIRTALKAFYETTDVTLPSEGSWYTIVSVNNAGNELPLFYADGAVTLGGTGSAFQVESITDAGIVVLKTKDGKYLHVLMDMENTTPTSAKNVTEEFSEAVNKLTLTKLSMGTDQKPYVGLFTMEGSLGVNKNTLEALGTAKALVDHNLRKIVTAKDEPLYFEEGKTSAFRFTSADAPSNIGIAQADFEGSKAPDNTTKLILTIKGVENEDDVTKVKLNNTSTVHFTHVVNGATVIASTSANPILEKYEEAGKDNQFLVHLNGLADDTYELILPIGTFDFSDNLKTVEDRELKASFTIGTGDNKPGDDTPGEDKPGDDQPGDDTPGGDTPSDISQCDFLPGAWGTIPRLVQGDPIVDADLKEVILYMNVAIYPNKDTNKNVVTLYERLTSKLVAQGHFESVTMDGRNMLKIVYNDDTPLTLPLNTGDYTFIIAQGAFGDENFNKYQNGDTSIQPSECKINDRFFTNLTVDNIAAGITTISAGDVSSKVVYDLQGRRVTDTSKKGVYIINGKLRVVK